MALAALEPAQAALEAHLAAAGAPAHLRARAALVLEELLGNVVLHAGPEGRAAPALLVAGLDAEGRCHLAFEAGGPAFDPLAPRRERPAPALDVEQPPGGLGLKLLRRVSDHLAWRRTPEGRNRTELRLRGEPKLPPAEVDGA